MARFETERTYVMIKPDGVQRGVVGNIISRFEAKGFVLKGLKLFQCPKALAEEHYKVSVCVRAKFAREPVSCLGDKGVDLWLTRTFLSLPPKPAHAGPKRQAFLQGPCELHLLRSRGCYGAHTALSAHSV
jgi:hypothetical protein